MECCKRYSIRIQSWLQVIQKARMDDSTTYYLYIISNKIDDAVYIGITNNMNRRIREHLNNPSNKHLNAAMSLYGKSNFIFTIIKTTTRDKIDVLESDTIKEYRNKGIPVYNVSSGGLIGNGSPGEDHWNHTLTAEDVLHIRKLYASNICTQRDIAKMYNTGYKNISKIVRGERWVDVGGDITLIKQSISKVANRRKLSDAQVVEVRNETYEEYKYTNDIDISLISELYGISRQSMRLVLTGISYKELPGPLLGKDYYREYFT